MATDGSAAGASATEALLAQTAAQYGVLLEVARRRATEMPELLPALQHDVVVLTAAAPRGAAGWFIPCAWRYRGRTMHELGVSVESWLVVGPMPVAEAVLVVLLHEATHLYAWTIGVRDGTRAGRHNEDFAAFASLIGLTVLRDAGAGVLTPTITPWARAEYRDLIDVLDGATALVRRSDAAGALGPGRQGRVAPALRRLCTRRWVRRQDLPYPLGFLACPTGKRAYPDGKAAVAALRAIQQRAEPDRNKGRTESAAYPCQVCPGWHLTSGPQTRRRNRAPRSRSKR